MKPKKVKIYVHSTTDNFSDDEGTYVAISERGTVIAHHYCTNLEFAKQDLGPRRKEVYEGLYPEGYEVECISAVNRKSHEGLVNAWNILQQNIQHKTGQIK